MSRLLFLIISLIPIISASQTFSEIIKAVAIDRSSADRFGYAVDISENFAVIGAYSDDFGATNPNMGSAYIFQKEGAVDWTFVQKINNSDQNDYDRFGWSVAISGDYIIVGAYAEDHNEFGTASLSKAGSAYLFERNDEGTWIEVDKIVASDRSAGDEFGWTVDISGNTAIVGAHFESHDLLGDNYIHHSGSVYIFNRLIDGSWSQSQKIIASDRSSDITYPEGDVEDLSDQFGQSIAIDNNYLIVGSHQNDYNSAGISPLSEAGAAYIFERSGGVWTEVSKLVHSDRETTDEFGFSVGISGNYAIVSAPREDDDLTGGGSVVNAGATYIFERAAGTWTEIQKIVGSDRHPGDRFGWSIDIHESTLAIGTIEANTDEDDTTPLPDAGAIFSFSNEGGSWNEINKLDASDRRENDLLGASVAIHDNTIIAGAYEQDFNELGTAENSNAGAVYFYNQLDCIPTSSEQTLTRCEGDDVTVGPYTHSASGTYIDVISSTFGCDSTVTTNLTVVPAPTYSQDIDICFGYNYIVGTSSYTTTGLYYDTLLTASGCDSIITTNLTVTPENAITQNITICWGETYTIGASTYDTPGTYTDIITSWSLCDCTITSVITQQLPVDKSISQSLNALEAGSDDASYQWIKCDPFEVIPGATSQFYTAPTLGQYAVIVTEDACTDTSSCVYVSILNNSTNIMDELSIYPNPSTGTFYLEKPSNVNIEAILFNPLGQQIQKLEFNKTTNIINLHNLPKGIYVLQLRQDYYLKTLRLIIE